MRRNAAGMGGGRLLIEAGIVLAVALTATALRWALLAPRLPLAAARDVYEFELKQPLVTPAAAIGHYAAGTHLFVDTRSGLAPGAPRIPGALPLRPEQFEDDLADIIDFIAPEDPVILYGERLQAAAAVAGRLAERGYTELGLLDGGLEAWTAAGGPLSPSREPGGEEAR